jgi:DNA-binding transcriptional LysR family regulator
MAYDLTDLQLFLQVVDHGSITRGAERSHLSLASASARISAMEKALGATAAESSRHPPAGFWWRTRAPSSPRWAV